MRIIKEQTAIANVSELRTGLPQILRQAKNTPVAIERHDKPIAVVLAPKLFAEIEDTLEKAEDIILAFEAYKREKSSKMSDYISIDELERHLR